MRCQRLAVVRLLRLLLDSRELLIEERLYDLVHELIAVLTRRLACREVVHQLVRLHLLRLEVHSRRHGRNITREHHGRGPLPMEWHSQAVRGARDEVGGLAFLPLPC